MNPVGTSIQKAPQKKGFLANQPRWLKVSMWISSGILGILVFFVFVAAVVLHTAAFHNYVLNKARTLASEQLGSRVDLQNFTLHLSTISLDIYGLTVYGAEPYPNPPLLQVQHAQAGVRIVSILSGKWYLNDIRVDHPVVRVYVDKN